MVTPFELPAGIGTSQAVDDVGWAGDGDWTHFGFFRPESSVLPCASGLFDRRETGRICSVQLLSKAVYASASAEVRSAGLL